MFGWFQRSWSRSVNYLKQPDNIKEITRTIAWGAWTGCMSFSVGLFVTTYVARPMRIHGNSMQGTIEPDDWVFIYMMNVTKYQRGDVTIFGSPMRHGEHVIKRIIGLEGDTVTPRDSWQDPITIPKGHCWIEGDNAHKSLDSNTYGPVPVSDMRAVATRIIWPPSHWKKLERSFPEDRVVVSPKNVK